MRAVLILVLVYASWLATMAIHESGHVLHAWLSGGKVSLVYFRPPDFSRTDLSLNPHPQFVAWGGPIWGSVIPLAMLVLVRSMRLGIGKLMLFFAGFCCVANGVYIGIGWIVPAGDAATLLHTGASPWVMTTAGLVTTGVGLYLWHRLGPRFGLGAEVRSDVDGK